MTKTDILVKIMEQEKKLDETEESLVGRRGPVEDALRTVIPMVRDNLEVMRQIVVLLP